MRRSRHDASNRFLSDRLALYELCELCRVFPGAGTPSAYLGLGRYYSDSICAEIDKGLAQFVRWYDARFDAQQKVGKHKWQQKHKTLADVLGITEARRRGGWTSGSELTEASKLYQQAAMKAIREGKPVPDIEQWIESFHSGVPFEGS